MVAESAIEALLNHQVDNIAKLEDALLAEQNVLSQHDPDALLETTKVKDELLATIMATDKQLVTSPNLKTLKEQGAFADLFEKIEQHLASCKSLNEINGKVIQQSQNTVNRIRTTIFESQGKSSLTYDEKAKTSTGVSNLDLKA